MTTVTSTRRIVFGLPLILAAGVLTGCDAGSAISVDSAEVQITTEGGVLVVACTGIQLGEGFGDIRRESTGEWVTFWEADGDEVIEAGTVGRFGEAPFGLDTTNDDVPVINAGDRIAVQLIPSNQALSVYSEIAIDDPAAVTGKWVNSRGEVSEAPCVNTPTKTE